MTLVKISMQYIFKYYQSFMIWLYIKEVKDKTKKVKKKKKKRSKNSLGSKYRDSGLPNYLQVGKRMRISSDMYKGRREEHSALLQGHKPSSSLLIPRVDKRHSSRMSLIEVLDRVIDSQLSTYSEDENSAYDSKVSKKSNINKAEEKDKIKYRSLNTNADILTKELSKSKRFIEDIAGKSRSNIHRGSISPKKLRTSLKLETINGMDNFRLHRRSIWLQSSVLDASPKKGKGILLESIQSSNGVEEAGSRTSRNKQCTLKFRQVLLCFIIKK